MCGGTLSPGSFALVSRCRWGSSRSQDELTWYGSFVGGPTTAAAMAVARRWNTLIIPAILCGTLGYAIATFIGVAVGYWLK